jgi:hypothetical protein
VRAALHGSFNDIPAPVWAAVHLDAVPPLLERWRERVHIGQRLRLHERCWLTFWFSVGAQRIEVGKIIAKFDISGRNANLYIRIYELARTPNIKYE